MNMRMILNKYSTVCKVIKRHTVNNWFPLNITKKAEAEKKNEALKEKINREKDMLEHQRDQQKVMVLINKEKRRLKEQDLNEL